MQFAFRLSSVLYTLSVSSACLISTIVGMGMDNCPFAPCMPMHPVRRLLCSSMGGQPSWKFLILLRNTGRRPLQRHSRSLHSTDKQGSCVPRPTLTSSRSLSNFTVTPEGILMGALPTRDSFPNSASLGALTSAHWSCKRPLARGRDLRLDC